MSSPMEPVAVPGSQRARLLVHIHGRNPMPECLRRALESECPDIRVECLALPDEDGPERDVDVVLVDESVALVGRAVLDRIDALYPEAVRIVSTRSRAEVGATTISIRRSWPLAPVVPMDLPLEVWLLTLRLAMTGFAPSEREADGLPAPRPELAVPPLVTQLSAAATPLLASAAPARLLTAGETPVQDGRAPVLTPRETQVMERLARGMQNKLIAAELAISEHTVKLHVHHILTKLGATNRTEAVALHMAREGGVGPAR